MCKAELPSNSVSRNSTPRPEGGIIKCDLAVIAGLMMALKIILQ